MNRERVQRHYRNYRRGPNFVARMKFCLRCLQFGHYRHSCRNDPIVTCGKCFRAYFFGDECVCNHRNRQEEMSLRMVQDQKHPRPCIDVRIGRQIFEAFFNQST